MSLLLYLLFFFWAMYFVNVLQSIWSPTSKDEHSASKITPVIQFVPTAEN